ncbi:hypothetical protein G6011_11022 [Alternaria panax]|uniref:Uncharacterized protein n=1 Tax=Alternaria panax TaxID=48097 RepID=A0AAD4ICS7_9PLEO|nr:hypothetical protein G6011_11022 [Alternaria panax]
MTTRPPLHTLPPPSANVVNTRYAHLQRPTSTSTTSAHGSAAMEEQGHGQEDMPDAVSVGSALSELEDDAEDEFDKRMIQNARDERRLHQARRGRPPAFSKARAHPRVGLTLDNLERNSAAAGADAHVQVQSPPSSSGSVASDPAIRAPATWGRKSRANTSWMRTITYEEEHEQQLLTPAPADDSMHHHFDPAHANVPRRSVEDSPLSHKGTPRNDAPQDWDLTFELNEASMIASTPYLPRSTVLDEIRQREMDSVKEQAVATARLDRIRPASPARRRPSSTRTADTAEIDTGTGTGTGEQATQASPSLKRRLRTRTHSWQSIGKAQPVTGIGKHDPPVAMYKSAENIATVDREAVAMAQPIPPRRMPNRREDSQHLLRRLARVSNTPSPRQLAPSRPESAPAGSLDTSSQTGAADTAQSESQPASVEKALVSADTPDEPAAPSAVQQEQDKPKEAERLPQPASEATADAHNADATPMPKERPVLNPKTPVVTGAWVDTPGPRTVPRPAVTSRSRSRSPKKGSAPRAGEPSEAVTIEPVRPQLPKSALQSLVDEAKSKGRRPSIDYGDSTINSLEDLITPSTESPMEEDTLQGLQLPTETPRNEAERQRQQELQHLYRMNDRLRAARTSIRDASRGMKRVEDQVDELYCQPMYAYSSPYPFSVNANAPKYPFVIPTLVYRTFVQGWWVPISSFFSWIGATMWGCFFGFQGAHVVNHSTSQTIRDTETVRETRWISEEAVKLMEEKGWDHSMFEDEILLGDR